MVTLRNAFEKCYPGRVEKYFAPFVTASSHKGLANKEIRELAKDNNQVPQLVPQILANKIEAFEETTRNIMALDYSEINLNLGCPSKTVVTKGKGAGFLQEPEALEEFLTQAYDFCQKEKIELSIKTRVGYEDSNEWLRLLELFNNFPIKELIIHPRLQKDYYLPNTCDRQQFAYAMQHAKMPIVYNGDLFSLTETQDFCREFPDQKTLMIGRGLLMYLEEFWPFHDLVLEGYQEYMQGDKNVLFKMKELWTFFEAGFEPENEEEERKKQKALKAIRKSQHLSDYISAIQMIRC